MNQQQIVDAIRAIATFLIGLFKRKQPSGTWMPPIADIAKQVVQNVNSMFFPAIYETQRNNKIAPGVTCAATSFSMVMQSLFLPEYGCTGTKPPREYEDVVLADIQKNCYAYSVAAAKHTGLKYLAGMKFEALREDFNFFVWYAFDKHGIECKVAYYSIQALYNKLISGAIAVPFMMSTSKALTSCGHIIVGRGAYEDKSGKYLSVNDPFGTYPYGSKTNGEGVSYALTKWTTKDNVVTLVPVNWPGKK